MFRVILLLGMLLIVLSCDTEAPNDNIEKLDYLIINGEVYDGQSEQSASLNIGVCGELICYIGADKPNSKNQIDAQGLLVTPGFIDPHTHSLEELLSADKNSNLNYLVQGVTTVMNGNDGDGLPNVKNISQQLKKNGIGTNVGLLVGHGAVRTQVMGTEEREATVDELIQMKKIVANAMQQGAFGLSSGLYYVPGAYSNTEEVVELAKIVANYGGIYDTHLRDESTFNIGFLNAVKEAIEIAKKANVHLHIGHIKALGVDVWGESKDAISLIEAAQKNGASISADQYPWQASGTYLNSAVMPSWVRADSDVKFKQRLQDATLLSTIKKEIKENIRRRGGANALLITESNNKKWLGQMLEQISQQINKSPAETAIDIALQEKVRVASFNMSAEDIERFMQQDWVVSSSDGTNGHPRKYASFPRKFQQYVKTKGLMTLGKFIKQSTSKTAEIFNIKNRGQIKLGYFADINLIDLNNFKAVADFSNWNKLSTGVNHQFINGTKTIENGIYLESLPGVVIKPSSRTN